MSQALNIDWSIIFSFCLSDRFLRFRYNNFLWFLLQTTPHRFLKGRPVGPRFVRFADLFYGALTVAAALWSGLRGFDLPFFG